MATADRSPVRMQRGNRLRQESSRGKEGKRLGLFIAGAAMLAIMPAASAWAGGGPFGIDHVVPYDDSGIWARSHQTNLAVGTALTVVGGALWFGDDNKIGDTFWRSFDAMAISAVTTEVMKFTFSRERPSQTSDPNRFFTGHGNESFPSGEVAEIASAVTPMMIAYGPDHPWVYGLAALPIYDAIARVKVHGHWQSDVLIGGAIGVGFGVYASHRETPFIVGLLPKGLTIGISKHF
jgi:membrane-associated phospholipid phosphatase